MGRSEERVTDGLVLCIDDFAIKKGHTYNTGDRFHVHGYVIASVQEVRKTVQSTLSSRAKALLKSDHRLLNPPADSFSEESKKRLDVLLSYSPLLR